MTNKKSFLLLASTLLLLSSCGNKGGYDTDHTHKFGEWEITTPATCTEDGTKTRECSCGKKETETITKTGHTAVSADTESTCTDGGSVGRTVCSTCGTVINEGTVLPPKGHHIVSLDEAATCTEDSYIGALVCTECGYVESEGTVVPATGHDLNDCGTCNTCGESVAIDLEFDPKNGEKKYEFTQNGKQYFVVNIAEPMKLGFGLFSGNGLGTSGYTLYNEDGTVIATNIKSVGSYTIDKAQKIYIVADVVDYTACKYFRIDCSHTYDPTGYCPVCEKSISESADNYLTSTGVVRSLGPNGYIILKLEPNESYFKICVDFSNPSATNVNFVVDYAYCDGNYLTVDSNNKFEAQPYDMFIKIRNAGVRGSVTVKLYNVEPD